MRVLIVSSGNSGKANSFVIEQGNSIALLGIEVEHLLIIGKGFVGYLKNLSILKQKINAFKPNLIHAHYGLSGLLSTFQKKVPVIITYHNGEILNPFINFFSSLSVLFSEYRIYVAKHIRSKMFFKTKKNYSILPCGIDLEQNRLFPSEAASEYLNLSKEKINILFGGAFSNNRKNYILAKSALEILIHSNRNINLIELKGYDRIGVTYLLNACNLLLLPSKSEGSPQIIKEAMACNCPIVATDVGDIKEIIKNTEGCFITSFKSEDVASKIDAAINFGRRTNGRDKIARFDNKIIAGKIYDIYKMVQS